MLLLQSFCFFGKFVPSKIYPLTVMLQLVLLAAADYSREVINDDMEALSVIWGGKVERKRSNEPWGLCQADTTSWQWLINWRNKNYYQINAPPSFSNNRLNRNARARLLPSGAARGGAGEQAVPLTQRTVRVRNGKGCVYTCRDPFNHLPLYAGESAAARGFPATFAAAADRLPFSGRQRKKRDKT